MKKTLILTAIVVIAFIGGIVFLTTADIPAPTQDVEKTLESGEYIQ